MDKYKSTAVVVGGSSGIGFEICTRLSSRGWNVVNISRSPCKLPKVKNISADVVSGSTFTDAVAKIGESDGIDVLIYCAGFSMAAPVEYAKESDYRYLFDVNFFGALKAVQTAIPFMKIKGGKIILVGSLGGDIPIIFDSFYSASKAALEMLVREAYCELKPYKIHITAFLPGGTATGFTFKRKVYTDDESKSYAHGLNKAVGALSEMEQNGTSAAEVAEDIYKLILTERPPVIKTCGFKNKVARFASRIMPERVTLYFDERMFKQ